MRDLLAEWAPSGTVGSLRLAVRNGYLNFYRHGQSVSKVGFPARERTATATIHHKYVRKRDGQIYLKIRPDEGLDDAGETHEWGGPAMLASWIAKAARHADPEKRQIDALLDRSPKVIDLEIALPARGERRSAPRIDAAALEARHGGPGARLVFWEVKRINDDRLRSRTVPKVVAQLQDYEDYVGSVPGLFEDAYRETCCVLAQFHNVASGLWDVPRRLDPLVADVANGACLEVDPRPRLLIIEDERPNRNWQHHRNELTKRLADRIHLVREGDVDPIEAVPRVFRGSTN